MSSDPPLDRLPDSALVARYLAVRDEEAFRLLVARHGPMVFCTCRRMLRQRQDAEDAFQAVFVTLAGYGRALRRVRSLGGWLHNVSVRVCHGVLRANRRREQHVRASYEHGRGQNAAGGTELRLFLDEELTALPAKYREVLVLCDLEGHTREEAARKLGASAGTVATWLARGRKKLRERLIARGVSVAAGGLAATLSQSAESAMPVPADLVNQTVFHAELFLAGKSAARLPAATKIGSLAQGVLHVMFLTKLSTTVCILALAAALVLGASPLASLVGARSDARAQNFEGFFDDLDDGSATDGEPVTWLRGNATNGTSLVVNGDYVVTGVEASFYPDEPGDFFRDGSVRAQLRFLESNSSTFAYIFARSPTAATYLGGIRQDGLLAIVESFDNAPYQIHRDVNTSLDPKGRDVILQLDAIGNRISLTAWHDGDAIPSQPQLVVFDDTLTFGGVGLGIAPDLRVGAAGQSQVAFRYFEAIPEPSTAALGSLGFIALASFICRTRFSRVRQPSA